MPWSYKENLEKVCQARKMIKNKLDLSWIMLSGMPYCKFYTTQENNAVWGKTGIYHEFISYLNKK